MKDFVLLLVILMCIVGMGMWQISFLNESSIYLKTDLQYIDYYVNLERYEDAAQEMDRVENTWENVKDIWGLFVHHDDIESVEVSIAEIETYIEEEAKEDARSAISRLIANIEYTIECEKIKLENIF